MNKIFNITHALISSFFTAVLVQGAAPHSPDGRRTVGVYAGAGQPSPADAHEAVVRWTVEQPLRGELQVVWSGQLPFEAELGALVCDVTRLPPPESLPSGVP
jgi:hypothetical protein